MKKDITTWEEVSMWKALKMWANNNTNIKCIDGDNVYFYNGYDEIKLQHNQVKNGKWLIEKVI